MFTTLIRSLECVGICCLAQEPCFAYSLSFLRREILVAFLARNQYASWTPDEKVYGLGLLGKLQKILAFSW
jgi:hypothetical protein